MLAYRSNAGIRRKPSRGRFGELTIEQARNIAKDRLADMRRGEDPDAADKELRGAMTIADLCDRFIPDHGADHNKPSSIKRNSSRDSRMMARMHEQSGPDVGQEHERVVPQ